MTRQSTTPLRIAVITASLCIGVAGVVLAGWIFPLPLSPAFGVGKLPSSPYSAAVFVLIATAHLLGLVGHRKIKSIVLVLAVILIAWTQFYIQAGMRLAFEQSVFGGQLAGTHNAAMAVNPISVTALVELSLLISAIVPGTADRSRSARIALWMATSAMMIGAVVLTAYLNRVDVALIGHRLFAMSFPTAMMSLLLAMSIVAWRHRDGWPALFGTPHEDAIKWPLLIGIVVVVQFELRVLVGIDTLDEGIADALMLVVNITAIIVIVARGSQRLAERRRERDELSDAVELAAVMIIDRWGIITHWSRGCQNLYGWTAEAAIGRHRGELLRSEMPCPPADIENALQRDGFWEGEIVETHRDGSRLVICDRATQFDHDFDESSIVIALTDVTERRAAEAELKMSETRLRAAVDIQQLTIVEWDIARHQLGWTINFHDLTGLTPPIATADLFGWSRNAISADDRAGMRESLESAIAEGRSRIRLIVGIRRGPDDLRIVDLSALIVYGESGPLRMIVACNDVTEHYRREEAIVVGEARLATAVAAQGIFIYEYDLIADRPIWTTRGESFLGADLDEKPEVIWGLVPEIAAHVRAAVDEALRDRLDRIHFSFDFQRLDGMHRRADSWARIISDPRGRPVRVIGTHLDITERYEREAALRASEAEMRAILATVPDAMVVCDETGIVRAFSKTAEDLFGYTAADLIGRNILELSADTTEDRAAMRREMFHVLNRARQPNWPLPTKARRSDGTTVPISFVIGDAFVAGQRMFVIFGHDMRPHIADEEKFHKLQSDLALAARLGTMGEMATALAHELSQPLAAVVNFIGAAELTIARDGGDIGRAKQAIRSAGEQATRAGEIVRRLRAFIARGEADMRVERITSLIREAAALALLNLSSMGVRVTYDFEDDDRLVLGDRIQIQQVLVNLIRNGVDAMTSSGCARREMVILTRKLGENLLAIDVRDSGPGIAPEILETLFQPFATTKSEGLGFGLSICRRIIEAHGGQLTADAANGGGAVFRFTLPIMEKEARRS